MSATVSSVSERHNNSSGKVDKNGAEFTREFIVKISAADEAGTDIAMSAAQIPALGSPWPYNVATRVNPLCISKQARPLSDDSRLFYLVECEYSNDPLELSGLTAETAPIVPPWQETPVWSYDYQEERRALAVDFDGEAVANSADDPFDPMPERTIYWRKVTITRNSLSFSPASAAAIQDTVNENAISINGENIPAKMAHLLRWTATTAEWTHPTSNNKTPYYEQNIEIVIAQRSEEDTSGEYPRGHLLDVVDAGYQYLDGGTVKTRFTNDDGTERASPGFLDGAGGELSGEDLANTGPAILVFRQYKTASWAALTLGGANL